MRQVLLVLKMLGAGLLGVLAVLAFVSGLIFVTDVADHISNPPVCDCKCDCGGK